MDRVFHTLTVRTLDEDQRVIEGWATTGRTDRAGDIVEPLGSEFDLPLPLLLDHNHTLAVGEVERAEVTSQGIRFQARIKKIREPGRAKDLTDEAWQLVKNRLRNCVSIGFQPLDYEPLPDGGLRFLRWSWYELSLCTVPANSDAVIETVKRIPGVPDRRVKLSQSDRGKGVVRLTDSELRRGRILAESQRFNNALRKAGVPLPVVRITGADIVEMELAAWAEKRKVRNLRDKMRGTVRVR